MRTRIDTPPLTRSHARAIIHGMRTFFSGLRFMTALFVALLMILAAPIHAAHSHEESETTTTMHAPCAVCQMHAPTGTPAAAVGDIVELDTRSHFIADHTSDFEGSFHGGITACRAPPLLLAA